VPLSFTDEELDVVYKLAAPIPPACREDFLAALAEALARYPVIGPGLLHRLGAPIQKRFMQPPRSSELIGGKYA
jgi:hypothetical protein